MDLKLVKYYLNGFNKRVSFTDYSEIPDNLDNGFISYDLLLMSDDPDFYFIFTIPFYFESSTNVNIVTVTSEEKEEKKDVCYEIHETPNGKMKLRFGIDDNDIDVGKLLTLKEVKMGNSLKATEKGLKYYLKDFQEFKTDIFYESEKLSLKIQEFFVEVYNDHMTYELQKLSLVNNYTNM